MGNQFRIYVPPKNKFILGRNDQEIKGRKDVPINLRPQHIFQALIIDPVTSGYDGEHASSGRGARRASTNTMFFPSSDRQRKALAPCDVRSGSTGSICGWFARSFTMSGRMVSDINYREFKDFEGGDYPSVIDFTRPQEDYSLRIRISKAVMNETLRDEQFVLEQPEGRSWST